MNIVVSNVKGGVGKTTTSVYLAAAAAKRGYDPVLLVDADRQASSAEWLEQRPVEGVDLVEAPSERTVARAMERHDGLAVVDTPPGDERIVLGRHRAGRRSGHPDPGRRCRVHPGGGDPLHAPSHHPPRRGGVRRPPGHQRP